MCVFYLRNIFIFHFHYNAWIQNLFSTTFLLYLHIYKCSFKLLMIKTFSVLLFLIGGMIFSPCFIHKRKKRQKSDDEDCWFPWSFQHCRIFLLVSWSADMYPYPGEGERITINHLRLINVDCPLHWRDESNWFEWSIASSTIHFPVINKNSNQ